jgi:hypothetical protein
MNDAERDRLVDNVVGHLLDGVSEPVLQRVFDYRRNVDTDPGQPHRKEHAFRLIRKPDRQLELPNVLDGPLINQKGSHDDRDHRRSPSS